MDKYTDIALIKIEGKGLPAATLGDSSNLRVGDTVLAIGNPFGLDQTVTTGIVSALNRDNMDIVRGQNGFGGYENFIQTDASINPGNSGGALVDHLGRVVGINTAIFSRVGGNIGIGFAIPVNMAVSIANRLEDTGTVERGYLGVMLGELTPELAQGFGLDDESGVLVQQVLRDSPAGKGGFQAGDLIKSYRGEAVTEMNRLRFKVADTAPGTEAEFGVIRDGKDKTLTVKIGRLPEDFRSAAVGRAPEEEEKSAAFLDGVEIANVNDEVRVRLRLPDEVTDGVVVTSVEANSKAAEAGLQAGQVILEVARKPVATVAEATQALKQAEGDVVLLRISAGKTSRFVAIERSE